MNRFIQSEHFKPVFLYLTNITMNSNLNEASMLTKPNSNAHKVVQKDVDFNNKVLDPNVGLHLAFSKWVANLSAQFSFFVKINPDSELSHCSSKVYNL